jgi:predicted MPP superfamily phosphohydrolase
MTRRQFIRFGAVIGATGLLASYPVFIERYLILTNHYIIPVPNLPQAFSGFRIVHLTDFHYGFLVPLAVIRYVIDRANRLRRDLIVSDCRLVLAHNPDTADTEFSGRIDLMISGHTHGGQIDLPFIGPPILPVQNKTYSSGLKTSPRGTKVFISKGIGWAIYPVRFNCAPEIAVLQLVPTKAGHLRSRR